MGYDVKITAENSKLNLSLQYPLFSYLVLTEDISEKEKPLATQRKLHTARQNRPAYVFTPQQLWYWDGEAIYIACDEAKKMTALMQELKGIDLTTGNENQAAKKFSAEQYAEVKAVVDEKIAQVRHTDRTSKEYREALDLFNSLMFPATYGTRVVLENISLILQKYYYSHISSLMVNYAQANISIILNSHSEQHKETLVKQIEEKIANGEDLRGKNETYTQTLSRINVDSSWFFPPTRQDCNLCAGLYQTQSPNRNQRHNTKKQEQLTGKEEKKEPVPLLQALTALNISGGR